MPETLAVRVKSLREKMGLTQDQLARRMDVPLTQVTRVEQGVTTDPMWSTMLALAAALSVTPNDLAGIVARPSRQKVRAAQ